MAKAPKKPSSDEDEAQSRRFLEIAKVLEDAGELNPTEAAETFELIVERVLPPRPSRKND